MSDNTRKMAKAEAPEFILTKGGVMIIGGELAGEKMLAIICEALAAKNIFGDTGLTTIVMRDDGYPIDTDGTPIFGMADADTQSISINLKRCWDNACKTASKGEKNLSFLGILWMQVLHTVGHEMDHLALAKEDRELYETMRRDEEGIKDLEESGNQCATQVIIELAKRFDMEPPAFSEMGYFAAKWMDLHTASNTKDLEWAIKARNMAGEGMMYEEKDKDILVRSFREFVKLAHDPDGSVEGWDQATTPVNLTVHLDNGITEELKAEPVVAPVVEVMDDEVQTETVELPENAGVMQMASAMGTMARVKKKAAEQFIGADVPIENDGAAMAEAAIGMVDGIDSNGQPTIDMAVEGVPLPQPVAEQQAQFATAAATATPQARTLPTTYTPNTVAPEVMATTMKAVWQTLYHHLFTKCGWMPNPQTGRYFFANPGAVIEGANIQHIIAQMGAENFIMEYDTLNAQGQPTAEKCQGMIRGYLTSKQGLPAYAVYLNVNGQRIRRSFLPQNAEKRNAQNAYTNAAEEAGGGGHMIAWVFKDEVANAAPFKQKCAAKIYDNIYEAF